MTGWRETPEAPSAVALFPPTSGGRRSHRNGQPFQRPPYSTLLRAVRSQPSLPTSEIGFGAMGLSAHAPRSTLRSPAKSRRQSTLSDIADHLVHANRRGQNERVVLAGDDLNSISVLNPEPAS